MKRILLQWVSLLKQTQWVICIPIFLSLTCIQSKVIPEKTSAPFTIKVIPQPRQISLKAGTCIIDNEFMILLESTHNEDDRFAAEVLQDELREIWGKEIKIVVDDALIKNPTKVIILGLPKRDNKISKRCLRHGVTLHKWIGQEGYVLTVDKDEIIIVANHSKGLFYGVQTLRQLVEKRYDEVVVPGVTIRDWPVYRYRGFQLDISNNPIPQMLYLKRIIRDLAFYKINMLMLYTEHIFAFEKYPDIAPKGSALTATELKELVAYTRKYHIDLIGNLQSFGHLGHILKLPRYAHLSDDPDTREIISPVNPATYDFLKDLFGELVPLYDPTDGPLRQGGDEASEAGSKFFCVNCAEPVGLGKGKSKSLARRIGPDGVYARHLNKLYHLLEPYRKRIMFWGDMILKYQRIIPQFPKDVLVLNWDFRARDNYRESIRILQKARLEQFVCPGTWSSRQIFPGLSYAIKNIKLFLKDGARQKINGTMLCSGWENDGEGMLETDWFAIAWFAECAWLPERSNKARFQTKFTHTFYGIPTTEGTKIIELLNQPNLILNPATNLSSMNQIFWEDPFISHFSLSIAHFSERLKEVEKISDHALRLINRLKWKSVRHKESVDALAYVAKRWRYLAQKFIVSEQLAQDYRTIYSEFRYEREVVASRFEEWEKLLQALAQELSNLQQEYLRLWQRRNRPEPITGSGLLAENLAKFERLDAVCQKKIAQLQETHQAFALSGILPNPERFGFQEKLLSQKEVTPVLITPEAGLTKPFTWWDPDWHYRLLIKCLPKADPPSRPVPARDGWAEKNKPTGPSGQYTRFNYPLEVHLNFSELLEEIGIENEEFDLNSIRVIEYDADKGVPLREIPYQFDPRPYFNTKYYADSHLVWIIKGLLTPDITKYFYIYFDTLKHGQKKSPRYRIKALRTYRGKKGSQWIENERIKVLLVPKGALITQWRVKHLKKLDTRCYRVLDIIRYSKENPLGFLQVDEYDTTNFDLVCEAKGPIMVRYRAIPDGIASKRGPVGTIGPGNIYKIITFYGNLPLCEVVMGTGIRAYRNYPDTECRDVGGEFIFSNYFICPRQTQRAGKVPICPGQTRWEARTRIKQDDTNWCAQRRHDGLTIGCLTPDTKVTHYIGAGILGARTGALNQPIAHFLIYADVTTEDIFHLFNQISSAFTYLNQPMMQRGRVEVPPFRRASPFGGK